MELRTRQVGEWTFREVQPNYFKAFRSSPKSIAMTGAAVEKELRLPFFHRWDRLEITQNDSSDSENTDVFDITLEKKKITDREVPQARSTIWNDAAVALSDYGVNLPPENSQREPATYTLSLTGTNTNLMYPILYFWGYPSESW